ncbi:MAG: DUF1295 domain-containing protein [Planctomycetota bacterium]
MTVEPDVQIVLGFVLMFIIMTLLWLVQWRTHNAGIVDVGWALGIGILGILFAISSDGYALRRVLVGVLIGLWSLRLAGHLLTDRVIGKPEEGRYQTLRATWGPRANRNLWGFFQIQAVLALLFALPVFAVARNPNAPLNGWDLAGGMIWIISVVGTAVSDRQLADFKKRPDSRGKTCRSGLWRYSRHPNYFFEWLHWWAYAAMAVGSAYWWIPLAAPLVMLFFLLKVSGIPPTEAQAVASRGEDYRAYQRTTSAFVPWFPKAEASRNDSNEVGPRTNAS